MAPPTSNAQRNIAKKTFRSLAALSNTASTSRILNLGVIARNASSDPEYSQYPLMRSCLNQAIILKHQLRRDEVCFFFEPRKQATKIIVPFDSRDLALGGRSIFFGQKDFREAITRELGITRPDLAHDEKVLGLIDQLPSLDPFLLREHLRRNHIKVASCYFDISVADFDRMQAFVADELKTLIEQASGPGTASANAQLSKMVSAILSADVNEKLEPLRAAIGMGAKDFREGAFCWKGFLYYKWSLNELDTTFTHTLLSIRHLRLSGPVDQRSRKLTEEMSAKMTRALRNERVAVGTALKVYDDAFIALVQRGDARAFREFLLNAPQMFLEIGEKLGAISHICSFWRFRFPPGEPPTMTADEAEDFFREYDVGMSEGEKTEMSWSA